MYNFFRKVRWYVGIALLLCLAITIMKYSSWIDGKLFGTSRRHAGVVQQPALSGSPGGGGSPAATTTQSALPADVRLQLDQAKSLLAASSASVKEALEHIVNWQREVEPLGDHTITELASEGTGDGMIKLLDRLSYVRRRERTSAQELRNTLTRIELLQTKVDDLLKQSNPVALSATEMADISQLHGDCREAENDWERDIKQALAIKHLLTAKIDDPGDSATPVTVRKTLEDADARALVVELDDQIEAEKERRAAEQAREAKQVEAQLEKKRQEAELLARATSPEAKALLAPFLEPRNIQPRLSGLTIAFTQTTDKKPMSLSALYAINALIDSEEGLKRLAKLGGHRKLPPPRWSVHSQPGNWSEDDREMLRNAQQMLRDYGAVLVSEGLLSQ